MHTAIKHLAPYLKVVQFSAAYCPLFLAYLIHILLETTSNTI